MCFICCFSESTVFISVVHKIILLNPLQFCVLYMYTHIFRKCWGKLDWSILIYQSIQWWIHFCVQCSLRFIFLADSVSCVSKFSWHIWNCPHILVVNGLNMSCQLRDVFLLTLDIKSSSLSSHSLSLNTSQAIKLMLACDMTQRWNDLAGHDNWLCSTAYHCDTMLIKACWVRIVAKWCKGKHFWKDAL